MAQGNHFLNIPKQGCFFMTIKSGRAGETRNDSPVEDEDEEETEEDVRLIPRCSPIPRKRGSSIADETAEYMRIRFALPQRRVSFADASGGELVDVREFAAFDSVDEDENDNWEEEEAECRRAYLQPVYRLWPEFQARAGNELTLAVRDNKVEVEKITAVEDNTLAFDALICVLNVSYHKCVYVRSTMDGWITHSDTAAEYVQDSHDGDTDKFSARLSFAEPYIFNGARIDFVVRYETSDGEFWANNSGRNYSVTLVMTYEAPPVNKVNDQEVKGILKPSRYRAEDDADFYLDTDDGNEHNTERVGASEISLPVCPLVIEPEIDIEIPDFKTRENPTLAECPLLSADRKDEHPQDLPENPLQTDHLGKKQVTELLIPTQNVIVDLQNDAWESGNHFTHYDNSNQPLCQYQSSRSAMIPSIRVIGEDDSEDLKDLGGTDVVESCEMRRAQLQIQTSDAMEVDNSESSLQEPQESLNELITGSASKSEGDNTGHDTLFEESHEPLLNNPEMLTMKHNTMIRRETSGQEQADLSVRDVADWITSCVWQQSEPTELGQAREESLMQNVSRPPRMHDLKVTEYEEQGQATESELNETPELLSVNGETSYDSTHADSKETTPMLTYLSRATATSQSLASTEETVTLEGGDGQPSMTHEEHLAKDKISFQKQEGLESQPALPCQTLKVPHAEFDVLLNTLIPAFACLSASVCLIVGFHEPSIFLIIALFLLLRCF